MSGTFSITVQEARGQTAVNADIESLMLVMGIASGVPTAALSPFYLSGAVAKTSLGYGDAVDTVCQIVEQVNPGPAPKLPCSFYGLPVGTRASYGTPDVSGVHGTVVGAVDSSVKPFGTYEAQLRFANSGIVGTTGGTYQTSLDGGRNWSRVTALLTASSVTIADGNVKFTLSPSSSDLTALNTLINDLFTEFNAHVIDVAASVHGAADTADVVSGGTYPSATSTATRVARMNALRAAYELHRVKQSSVHGSSDATNVIAAAVCTDDSTCLVLALDFKAKYNAHIVDTTAAIHGSADAANGNTDSAPSAGAFLAGDVVKVRTISAIPAYADVDAAFTALARSSLQFGVLVCDFAVDSTMFAHLVTGWTTLLGMGKRVIILTRSRIPNAETSETEAAWFASVAADLHGSNQNRTGVSVVYGLVTDAMTGRKYLRNGLQQIAADVARVGIADWFDSPSDQQMANFSLVDANGVDVGHDEGPRGAMTGLSDETQGNRFICVQRLADASRLEQVFITAPWTMFASTDQIQNIMTARVCNLCERAAVTASVSRLGGKSAYKSATQSASATLTDRARRAIQGVVYKAVSQAAAPYITNAADASIDTGLVGVNQGITVSGGNLLAVSGTLHPEVFGYVKDLTWTLNVKE